MLRFDGRVALVTGAGGGLGREYALLFADRGAAVVVNDLGGDPSGSGSGKRAADKVVEEIQAKGGKAVANYDSVESGHKVIETAIKNFGRIDILVNNAGILRDKAFRNMSTDEWDAIHRVHLRGAFLVTKAAWPHMRKQDYGRVIMTASNSGIYGNFGQANYSSAKLGLVGLTNTLAREGSKYGIHVMSLVPTASSRLTASIMPDEVLNALHPRHVAPLVVWLCHEECHENGGVYEAAAGWFGKLKWYRSSGRKLASATGRAATPEEVKANWDGITDMRPGNLQAYDNMDEAMSVCLDDGEPDDTTAPSIPAPNAKANGPMAIIGHKFPDITASYTEKDVMLYAAGVGATVTDPGDLQFLYENHDSFTPLPTFPFVSATTSMSKSLPVLPGIEYDPAKLLHGEEYLEVFKSLPTKGTVVVRPWIGDVIDKGSAAIVVLNTDGYATGGERLFRAQAAIFLRGAGGFGGKRSSDELVPLASPPKRAPDAVVEQATSRDQAVIYRLASGDFNPLHIDPQYSQMGGFEIPILHGLASYGYAARHVLRTYGDNDPSTFKAIKARFSGPVVPGQTLITRMWQADAGDRVHFEMTVKETGKPVITGGFVDFAPRTLKKTGAVSGSTAVAQSVTSGSSLKSVAVFDELRRRLEAKPEMVKKVNAIYLWIITKDGKEAGRFTVDLKTGKGDVYTGEPRDGVKAGVSLTLDDDTMVGLTTGAVNPQKAFMQGKLKIKGNLLLTQKLQGLLKNEAKL